MIDAADENEFRSRMQKIETLIQEIDRFRDPAAREHARQIVQSLMDLHGTGIGRMLEHIASAGEAGQSIIDSLAQDDLVGNLLLLYGLHPLDVETRVGQALKKVRPYLHSHGGNVELLRVEGDIVHLQMQGSCHGCPSSAVTLKDAIEQAIYEAAPDVTAIRVEGETVGETERAVDESASTASSTRFALPILQA